MDVEKLIEKLQNAAGGPEGIKMCHDAATTISALQAENAQLRAELEYEQEHANAYHEECEQWEIENAQLRAELEQVKQESDAAVEAVKNMAEYIVCAGRVDYYLCDEISQQSLIFVTHATETPHKKKWQHSRQSLSTEYM